MPDLEIDIENEAVDIALSDYKFLGLKFKSATLIGAPDRIFLGKQCHVFFIEFKKTGGHVKGIQKYFHKLLRQLDFRVYVCWTLKEAVHALEIEHKIHTKRLPKGSN